MFARIPCQRRLKTKPIMIKRPTLQNLRKQNMYTAYSRKRIIQAANFQSQNFDGLTRPLSKKYYQIIIIWYAKMASTRRKCFIRRECVSSHPTNHRLTYQSSPKKINPIPKRVLIMTIYVQERWRTILSSHFFDAETTNAAPPNSKAILVQSDIF